MLLGREDAEPNIFNIEDKIPLTYAAQSAHEGVVEALLARASTQIDRSGMAGRHSSKLLRMGMRE